MFFPLRLFILGYAVKLKTEKSYFSFEEGGMKRGLQGRCMTISKEGEKAEAFVPALRPRLCSVTR